MFKRKKKIIRKRILKEDFDFLKAIISKLPSKYDYLKRQVTEDFLLGKTQYPHNDKGTYTLSRDAKLAKKYADKKLTHFFILRGIKIFNKSRYIYEDVELYIVEGMLAGFKITARYRDLDLNKIDITGIKEKHFKDEDKETVSKILGKIDKDLLSQLDVSDTFKIEIEEGEFYVIKNLGDGNYLSINKQGAVYGMIHDPYEIELLFENKEDFFKALSTGKFDIQEYYRSKFS